MHTYIYTYIYIYGLHTYYIHTYIHTYIHPAYTQRTLDALKRKFCVDAAVCGEGEAGEAPTHPPTHLHHLVAAGGGAPEYRVGGNASCDNGRLLFSETRTLAFRGGVQGEGGETRSEGDEAENTFKGPGAELTRR